MGSGWARTIGNSFCRVLVVVPDEVESVLELGTSHHIYNESPPVTHSLLVHFSLSLFVLLARTPQSRLIV